MCFTALSLIVALQNKCRDISLVLMKHKRVLGQYVLTKLAQLVSWFPLLTYKNK